MSKTNDKREERFQNNNNSGNKKSNSKRKNKYNPNHSKGNQEKFNSKNSDKTDEMPPVKGNDLNWWVQSAQLLTDDASISWGYRTGVPMDLHGIQNSASYTSPGVCAVQIQHVPGVNNDYYSGTKNSPINVAAKALYTNIRRNLKSANSYEASDVMIYIAAMSEIFGAIGFATRAYATAMNYSFENAYLPEQLYYIQGLDPSEWFDHPADIRTRLNHIIVSASQIWCPKGFGYNNYMKFVYQNYYIEGSSLKDQIYMFTPATFRYFTYDSETKAGMLSPVIDFYPIVSGSNNDDNVTRAGKLVSATQLLDAIEYMIMALVDDSDFQNISGDLFNCFGAAGVETFELVPENAVMQFSYNEKILHQIHNARCLDIVRANWNNAFLNGMTKSSGNAEYLDPYPGFCFVTQDETANKITTNATISGSAASHDLMVHYPVLNLIGPDNLPNPEKTFYYSRYTNTASASGTSGTYYLDAAQAVVVNLYFACGTQETLSAGSISLGTFDSFMSYSSYVTTGSLPNVLRLRAFKYAPIMYYFVTSGSYYEIKEVSADLDVYTVLDPANNFWMNYTSMLTAFGTPDTSTVNKMSSKQ